MRARTGPVNMKIPDQNLTGIAGSRLGATEPVDTGRKSSKSGPGAGGDQVQISDLARTLQLLSPDSPERAAHLEKLAEEVAGGRYRVDALEMSRRIVDEGLSAGDRSPASRSGNQA